MCGRFANSKSIDKMKAQYGASSSVTGFEGSYNIAPTELAPIVIEQGSTREIKLAKFGIPMQHDAKKFPLINIQSEKAPARADFQDHRCVIPVEGFYEWEQVGPKDKRPHYFSPRAGMFNFAGLWKEKDGELSFSILTTRANHVVGTIHNRMPVILGHNSAGAWMGASTPQGELEDLLQPYADGFMQEWEVSKVVNRPMDKSAACINSL